jgi:CHASE2 domain-containing sensor protein
METYRPVMKKNRIVKFTQEELETLLEQLEQSGAQEIGVDIEQED